MKILYKTISGSRLYGLDHADSDWDYYTVVDRVKKNKASYSTHTIIDGVDSVVVDFGTWVNNCVKGVPQALEAMFSTKAEIDLLSEYRASFRAGTNYEAYRGMMKTMAFEHADSFKHKRHMLRLGLNLLDLRGTGRFNPTLDETEKKFVNHFAEKYSMDRCYKLAERLAWLSD